MQLKHVKQRQLFIRKDLFVVLVILTAIQIGNCYQLLHRKNETVYPSTRGTYDRCYTHPQKVHSHPTGVMSDKVLTRPSGVCTHPPPWCVYSPTPAVYSPIEGPLPSVLLGVGGEALATLRREARAVRSPTTLTRVTVT